MDAVKSKLEHSLLNEARSLVAEIDDLVNSTPEVHGTDLPPATERASLIAKNSTLLDGLATFIKFDSGLTDSTIEELTSISELKTTLVSRYDSSEKNAADVC